MLRVSRCAQVLALGLTLSAACLCMTAVASAATSATLEPGLSGPAYPNATEPPRLASTSTSTVAAGIKPLYFEQCAATANPLCMWQDANYGGLFWFRNESTSTINAWHFVGNLWGTETPFNDRASSVYCRRSACGVSADWAPSSRAYCLPKQWVSNNLTEYVWQDGSSMNDSISSYNLQTGC
jgi:hypothetical protein